jgi:hypothetical protein
VHCIFQTALFWDIIYNELSLSEVFGVRVPVKYVRDFNALIHSFSYNKRSPVRRALSTSEICNIIITCYNSFNSNLLVHLVNRYFQYFLKVSVFINLCISCVYCCSRPSYVIVLILHLHNVTCSSLLGNGLLKHVSEVMRETSIPRQRVQKRFRCDGWVMIFHTATKDMFRWQPQNTKKCSVARSVSYPVGLKPD